MLRAFKLYTGSDGASHVLEGTIDEKDRTDVIAIHFKETPAHSSYDWHPDPEPQFVITLSGTRNPAVQRSPPPSRMPKQDSEQLRFAPRTSLPPGGTVQRRRRRP